MSRIGKKPVLVPAGVTVRLSGQAITVTGPKGNLSWTAPESSKLSYDESGRAIRVDRSDDQKQSRANHGLSRALIANMVTGVAEGFQKCLQIYGTGFNCKLQGGKLHLNVGYSGRRRGVGSQFEIPVPKGIEVAIEREAARGDNEPAQMIIRGTDKQQVGQFSAEVRSIRITEPYKGKGIRYLGERVVRKQGKALTGTGG